MRTKKHLGQHFLNDQSMASAIVDFAVKAAKQMPIIEIGPGKGALTQYLISSKANFLALDVDDEMLMYLCKMYPSYQDMFLWKDFLQTDVKELFPGQEKLLLGNFPYNISSQILFKMLDNKEVFPKCVAMFQREVAQRIAAKHGNKKYGILSVLIQAYYKSEIIFELPPASFTPPPRVHSAVIYLEKFRDHLPCDPKLFKQIVKLSFNKRRKMLKNTLKGLIPNDELLIDPIFTKRPEQLSVDEFIDLTLLITENNYDAIE